MGEDNFRHIRKIIKQQDQIRKTVEPYNRIQKMLEPTRRVIDSTRQFAQMNESIIRMRAIESRIPVINPAIKEHADRMDRIRESIDLFNKNLPVHLIAIASYGWYLDLQTDMDLSIRLAKNIDNEETEKVDLYLIDYYQKNFEGIISKLQKNHPKRKRIFEEIKIGFDNSHYNLVIPLILSQIDGICHDWTKKLFFIKNKKNEKNPYLPKVSNELIAFNGQFIEAFLAPFLHDAPIFAHEANLDSFPIGFNRHKVLHGLDTEFGSKINCLKALSLMSYCEDILLRLIHDFNEDE
jgi:hypothetical protein